ncbi:MAG TPA: Rid family detoxifying hydrolase [Vicinamibacteria bacterium]|nr:Rid family detoxifying hydrolase [Vicinamibacteria bacterium]
MRQAVTTDKAPRPGGAYSQAIVEGNLIFLAGQVPANPATGELELGDIRSQTARVLENIRLILEAAGSSLDNVVRCSVYLKDIADFAAMNEVYAATFREPYPARTTVQVGLARGMGVEIDCIARR